MGRGARELGLESGTEQNTEDAWLFLCLKSLRVPSSPGPLRPVRVHPPRRRLKFTTRP